MKWTGVCAQDTELKNFAFYSQKDGLSNYNIHKIIQDDKKFLWIATQDGLNRFDGTSFIEYNKGLSPRRALLSNDIRDLIYDTARQVIWVVCNQGGINGIDVLTGNVICAALYSDPAKTADWRTCAVLINRTLFVGSSGGVEAFDVLSHAFIKTPVLQRSFPAGCSSLDVHAITADGRHNLWIAARDKGILVYSPAQDSVMKVLSFSVLQPSTAGSSFWPLCLAITPSQTCWIGTDKNLMALQFSSDYHMQPLSLQGTAIASAASQPVSHLSLSREGDLLVCGSNLYRYSAAQNRLSGIQPADKGNDKWLTDITCCYEDGQGNLWLGCKQGLGQMKNTRLAFMPVHNGKTFGDALSHLYGICAIDSTHFLAGTKEGLYAVDNENQTCRQLAPGLFQNIFRLQGDTILLSGSNGLYLWMNRHLVPLRHVYPEFSRFPGIQLNSCAWLNDTVAILGTESYDGILAWNAKRHSLLNIREGSGLFSDVVNTVFISRSHQAFVLSDLGITVINGPGFHTRKLTWKNRVSGVPSGIFMDMTEAGGYYWLNTYGEGLLMMDSSFRILQTFGVKDGLSNTGLYKIFNYRDSLLLLTSNYGITSFDIRTRHCRRYYEEDGIHNNTFEEACGDMYRNAFYAGGVEGFTVMQPSRLLRDTLTPDLYFTKLTSLGGNGQPADTSDVNLHSYSVSAGTVQTNIYFSGIDFNNSKRVHYSYRINGKDWIDLNTQNFVSLVGLPTGTYLLQVKAGNEDGLWSQPKELQLIYLPAWYETIWFDIAVSAIVFLVLYGFYRYRINQIKKQQLIRKNIASDLHDDLGSTLNTMKVFTHLAQKDNHNQHYLSQIESSVTEAIAGLRDMIWVLDDSQDTLIAVMDRTVKFAKPVSDARSIRFEYRFEPADADEAISKTEKRNLLLMLKEGINNSIKYAGCSRIQLVFRKEENKVCIELADDGQGFEPETVVKGNGLQNLHYRAAQIHYRIEVSSTPGRGTVITMTKN